MRRLLQHEGGNVIILAAFCIPVLVVGTGVAVDHATLLRAHDDLQNLADSAALAGARELANNQDESDAHRERLAVDTATDFVTSRASTALFSVKPSASEATVEVSISAGRKMAFGGLLGQSERSVAVEAVATYKAEKPSGCLIALDESEPSGLYLQGAPKVSAPGCGIWSNAKGESSIHMQGAPSLRGAEVCADGASGNAVNRIDPEYSDECGTAPDPYGGRLDGIPTACDYTNFSFTKGTKEATLEPGVYCGGLEIKGLAVTLNPGLYVIKDGPLAITSNASVVGNRVSIALTGEDAALQMQGSPDLTLTAMETGDLAGIALAVTATGTEAVESEMQGSPALNVTGSVYMPDQRFRLQGNPQLTVKGNESKLVARSFTFKGSPDLAIEAGDTKITVANVTTLRLAR